MAKEDLLLRVEMGKLEIEPAKSCKPVMEDNPFNHTPQQKICMPSRRNFSLYHKCSCVVQKTNSNMAICKKRNNKIIKEPVLKILQSCKSSINLKKEINLSCNQVTSQDLNSDILNLCALVDNCNQLRISSGEKKQKLENEVTNRNRWWKNDVSHIRQLKPSTVEKSQVGSCSQQALNPPCDVTIDELASYFETLVHIPKKMSSMAEMMYI